MGTDPKGHACITQPPNPIIHPSTCLAVEALGAVLLLLARGDVEPHLDQRVLVPVRRVRLDELPGEGEGVR